MYQLLLLVHEKFQMIQGVFSRFLGFDLQFVRMIGLLSQGVLFLWEVLGDMSLPIDSRRTSCNVLSSGSCLRKYKSRS